MGSIGFIFILTSTLGPFTYSKEEMRRRALEAVVKLLPNIRRVELTLAIIGREVPDYQVKGVVFRAIRIVSPLRDITSLVLRGANYTNTQRMRIIREVREALRYI